MGKRILMVAANPAVSTTTGWPVGFWAAELIHPYDEFTRRGYAVTIASPAGGQIELDALSDPNDASGYSKDDALSARYLADPAFQALLVDTPAVSSLDEAEYDAIVVVGGQSPMFTFREAHGLQEKFSRFVASGKPHAALCHGVCLLLYLRGADGQPFVQGRRITGFSNAEEDFADSAVGQKVMPFRIEDEARALGAEFVDSEAFSPHAVVDGLLVTGQQQHSGRETALRLVEVLEGRG